MSVFHMKTCIGIDLAGRRVIAVRATRSGRGVRFEAAAVPAGGPYVAGMPAHSAIARRMVVPLASPDKARRVLPSLLDVQLPFPIESCIHQFLEVGAVGHQTEALAIAARREDVRALLDRLRSSGVDPIALDHEALSLWDRFLAEMPPSGDDIRAILYAGEDRHTVVVGRGARFISVHGGRLVAPDAQRIHTFLRAHLNESADLPFDWAITGPRAADVSRADLKRPEGTRYLNVREPETFLARAYAARALRPGPLICNFRIGEFEHPAATAGRAAAERRSSAMVMAAAGVVLAMSLGWWGYLRHRDAALQSELTALAAELTGIPKPPRGQEVMLAKRAAAEQSPRLGPFNRMLEPSLLHAVGNLLSVAGRSGVTLSEIRADRQAWEARGRSADWESAGALVSPMASRGWRVEIERGDAGADERVPFRLKGVR